MFAEAMMLTVKALPNVVFRGHWGESSCRGNVLIGISRYLGRQFNVRWDGKVCVMRGHSESILECAVGSDKQDIGK